MHMLAPQDMFHLLCSNTTLLARYSLFQETFELCLPGLNYAMDILRALTEKLLMYTKFSLSFPFYHEVEVGSRFGRGILQ